MGMSDTYHSSIRGEMPLWREVLAKISSGIIEKNGALIYIEEQCSKQPTTSTGSTFERTCAFDISTVEV